MDNTPYDIRKLAYELKLHCSKRVYCRIGETMCELYDEDNNCCVVKTGNPQQWPISKEPSAVYFINNSPPPSQK